MILLNSESNIIEDLNGEIVSDETILSKLNDIVKFKPNETITLIGLSDIIGEYPSLFKVFPKLSEMFEAIKNIISLNEIQSISGSLKISERYELRPIISDHEYGKEITPYLDIKKRSVIYYFNCKSENVELTSISLKHIIEMPIAICDKENVFFNMFENKEVLEKCETDITLNNFLKTICTINFKL